MLDFVQRLEALRGHLDRCRLCGNLCDGNRVTGENVICGAGPSPVVTSVGLLPGQDNLLSRGRPVGTIAFLRCGLECVYCADPKPSELTSEETLQMDHVRLSEEILRLQEAGAGSIRFHTPSVHLHTLVPALYLARMRGLNVPVIYGSSAFETVEALRLLEGLVDVYFPTIKYGTEAAARVYSGVVDYVNTSRQAVVEMFRQVGAPVLGPFGAIQRGLVARHIPIPAGMAGTIQVLTWVSKNLPLDTPLCLSRVYRPVSQVATGLYPEIAREVTAEEYDFYLAAARNLGLTGAFLADCE
jgi:putative pyruvate formate lyase activating enzyme